MKILAFDCSNGTFSACISDDKRVIASHIDSRYSMQAEAGLPAINDLLSKAGLSITDMNYIATMRGPGSFTGVRIGLAIAAGIKRAHPKIKILGLTGFELIYWKMQYQVQDFDAAVILINGPQGKIYNQIFDNTGRPLQQPEASTADAIKSLLKDKYKNKRVICCGNACSNLELFDHLSQPSISVLPRFKQLKAHQISRAIFYMINKDKPKLRNITPQQGTISPLYIMSGVF